MHIHLVEIPSLLEISLLIFLSSSIWLYSSSLALFSSFNCLSNAEIYVLDVRTLPLLERLEEPLTTD